MSKKRKTQIKLESPCIQDKYRTFTSIHDLGMKCTGSGERELWAAVLQQGVDEAGKKHDSYGREEARRFIDDPAGMFPIICNTLEIDQNAARERIVAKWRVI